MRYPDIARALAGFILIIPAGALAEDAVIETDPVIVSAARGPVSAANAGRAVTVITGEELERRQVRFVADALRQVPGLSVSRAGSNGGLTQVRVRGAEANQVLVLIDGVEAPNSSGGFDFSLLAISDIERIEVVRGPQSAVWGANAAAGVINIITRRGARDPAGAVTIGAEIEGGSDLTRAGSAFIRAGNEWLDLALSGSFRDEGGFDTSGDPGGRRDGTEIGSLGLNFTADPVDALTVSGVFRLIEREGEADETDFGCGTPECYVFDFPAMIEETDIFTSLRTDWRFLGGRATASFNADYSFQDRISTGAFGATPTLTDTLEFGGQVSVALDAEGRHVVTGGAEFTRESFEGGIGVDESRDQTGVFGEYRGTITDDLYLQTGLRYDINEGFENAFTWSVAASYRVAQTGTRFHGSVGEGTVNPDFFEQFGFIPASFVGNPDLQPEKNFAWDIGVEQAFWGGRVVLDVTYFRERLQNEIITVFGFPTSTAANLAGESERQGVEVALSLYAFEGFEVTGTYTWLDASEPNGDPEIRRPEHSAGLTASYRFLGGDAGVALDASWNGAFKDRDFSDASFTSPIVELDGFVLVDVAIDYRFNENVTFFGRVENVLDQDYSEILGYDGQPLTGYAGVRVTF